MNRRSAFTLIELLVVIAIIAIIAVAVVLVLNPAQLLQQSRDAGRISDLASLNSALGYYMADAALSGTTSLGSANAVYASIPDAAATSTAGDQCQGLGLPLLPANYSYHCAASSTFRSVNGTGWLPVNFAGISNGSPLGQLPVDPTNSSSSRLYYTYATNGTQYEITAGLESQKYKLGGSSDVVSGDGGTLATVFEKGTKLGLEPLDYGDPSLAGYWTFDEGTGTVAYDYSGSNATGSWSGTATGTSGYYSAGKIGSFAGAFDGSSTYSVSPTLIGANKQEETVTAWVYSTATSTAGVQTIFSLGNSINGSGNYLIFRYNTTNLQACLFTASYNCIGSNALATGTWQYVTFVHSVSKSIESVYLNGQLLTSGTIYTDSSPNHNYAFIGEDSGGSYHFNGLIDDARIYSRALSAAEIQAMYNGGK